MPADTSPTPSIRLLYWAAVGFAWNVGVDKITLTNDGRTKFVWMLPLIALTLIAPWLGRGVSRLSRYSMKGLERALRLGLILASVGLIGWLTYDLVVELRFPATAGRALDIAENTAAAGRWFLAGRNPYANPVTARAPDPSGA